MYGQFGVAHMSKYGTKKEHFAMIAVKNHHNGTLDPYAHFQFEVTMEQVMNAPMISWPLGLFDCCPTTDGAAAIILTREDIARQYTDKPVYLWSSALACDDFYGHQKRHYHQWDTTTIAAKTAYEMAGISPKDIDVAEIHDCFTCTELIDYEDLGFCERGKGGQWIENGGPMIDGEIPCNVSGGLKSKGHPIGATGVAQACEIFWQLRGEAGKRQVKDPKIGLTHNLGGTGAVALVNIFGTEPK
jgi:acetyl-CoA C-acetyltransferase